ncbi:hypothetical protein [Ruminococcus intestinalis]|uniref:hypothetical protein n=1 Tax=Ruminococcus intestinalis TaxID=2763066 RepID=UPI003F81AE66
MQEETIFKALFNAIAPYLLIIANFIVFACILRTLWIIIKNKSRTVSSETIAFSCLCQFFYYIMIDLDLHLWLSIIFLSAFLIFYNSVKRLQDGTYTFPTHLLMLLTMYIFICKSIPIFFIAILVSLPIPIRLLWIENKDR